MAAFNETRQGVERHQLVGIGGKFHVKERHLAKLTWRSFVFSTLTASSLLTGVPQPSEACCLFGGMGDCCGGGGGYSGFYRGGYYGGYAPYYGNYAPAYGYGPAYGSEPSYGYGNAYASASNGCSSCVGGGCGVSSQPANPTRPEPDPGVDDGYRKIPGRNRNDLPPAEDPPRRSRMKSETAPVDPPATPARPGTKTRDDGLGRGALDSNLGDPGAVEEQPFEKPRRSRSGETNTIDQFDTNKPPMPKAAEESPKSEEKKPAPAFDDDSFGNESEDKSVEVKRPDLGSASDTDQPADADSAAHPNGDVIPPRHAPLDIPDPEEVVPESTTPEDLKQLEEKPTSAGVAPKVRMALRGRFGTPSIVRLKLRPNHGWQPTPTLPVLAKH